MMTAPESVQSDQTAHFEMPMSILKNGGKSARSRDLRIQTALCSSDGGPGGSANPTKPSKGT